MYYLCHVQKGLAPPIEFDRENNHINHQKQKKAENETKPLIDRQGRLTKIGNYRLREREANKTNQKQNKSKKQKTKTMKKILLLIGLSIFTFGAFAEKVPTVIVNKSQGGFTAIFNLYNYVSYTPAEVSANGVGHLDCSGTGFSACRVPNCTSLNVMNGNVVAVITEAGKLNAFKLAINDVIQQYETALENNASAVTSGHSAKAVPTTYTKTVAFASKGSGKLGKQKTETYVVRGVVKTSANNTSTMMIYIEKTNLLSAATNL